jgi:hypothetical protein
MASIISEINWIANGERADSVTLNRPLLEFLTKYEIGDVSLSSNVILTKIDNTLITNTIDDYDVVSLDSAGLIAKSDSSNKMTY